MSKRTYTSTCRFCKKEFYSTHSSYGYYCSNKCQRKFEYEKFITKWKKDKNPKYSITIRKYIFKKYNNKCSECGWSKINPYTKKSPLELEHIDGNSSNNKEENLTLLCPNCHSLTSTYKGANKGKGRFSRMQRYKKGQSY